MNENEPQTLCAVPDSVTQNAECRIPKHHVTVGLPNAFGPYSFEELSQAWLRGAKYWTDVANLTFEFRRARGDEDIQPGYGRIDGPSGVLGWSQFPCPWRPPIIQKYDTSERYSLDLPPTSGISLPELIAHEIGHALGIAHQPRGNVMYRLLTNSHSSLGPADRREVLERYGPAVDDPSPPPPPDDPDPPDDPPPPPPEPPMNRFLQCLIQCLLNAEREAQDAGQEGPLLWLLKEVVKGLSDDHPE